MRLGGGGTNRRDPERTGAACRCCEENVRGVTHAGNDYCKGGQRILGNGFTQIWGGPNRMLDEGSGRDRPMQERGTKEINR